jgi:glycine oxidase
MPPRNPTDAVDVAVLGGGIIGLAVAWRAAQAGATVCVLERDEASAPTGAWHVAAGMLAPVTEADIGEPDLLALGLRGAEAWPGFAAELQAASGIDPGYRRSGALVVARDRDEAEALEREQAHRDALGVPVERLLPSAARRLEPALAPTVRLALHAPEDHSVDPRAVVAGLAAATRAAGAQVRRAEARELLVSGERVTGVRLAGGVQLRAEQVVVAAGAWAGALPGLPEAARVPVRPVKGQILRLRDPEGPGLLERIVRYDGGYLVPRADGGYVLGATMEERGFDTTVTAGGLHELLRDAFELVPGVLELVLEESLAGLRPGTPDNAPVLGRSPVLDGLVWAAGHHRNGVLLAPVSAALVAGALAGRAVPEPFAPGRFAPAARPQEVPA